jgi:hypothetical protein
MIVIAAYKIRVIKGDSFQALIMIMTKSEVIGCISQYAVLIPTQESIHEIKPKSGESRVFQAITLTTGLTAKGAIIRATQTLWKRNLLERSSAVPRPKKSSITISRATKTKFLKIAARKSGSERISK